MLEPATYSRGHDARRRYRPAFPWGKVSLVLALVVVGGAAYTWRQKVRADGSRAELQATYDTRIAPVVARLEETRARSVQLALDGRQDAGNRIADKLFRVSALHDKKIGYLRLSRPALQDAASLHAAVDSQGDDAIGACLGLTLRPLKELTEVPDILKASWITDAEPTNDSLRMEIRKEQLARAIDRELPALAARLPVDYFLLLVVQGADRAKDPVDVFLWELESKKKLLQMRTEPIGRLISVRNQVGGGEGSPAAKEQEPLLVADCSLAGQIKSALGEPTMMLGE